MSLATTRTEWALLAACSALLFAAVLGPPIAQPAGHHHFADTRLLWDLPYAMDVVSNIPFALAAVLGFLALWRAPSGALSNVQRAMSLLFFAGLLLTSLGSAWYHLQPDDAGLAIDRYAMAVAFAGVLGLAAARISERAGAALGLGCLLLAPLAVHAWATTGNVLPWAIVQFGGLALVWVLSALKTCPAALPVR